MFESSEAGAILDRAEAAQAAVDAGEVDTLRAAADWAHLHDTVAEPEHVLEGPSGSSSSEATAPR